jgi:hypothetical protein
MCRESGIAKSVQSRLQAGQRSPDSIPGRGKGLHFSTASYSALKSTQPPTECISWDLSLGENWRRRAFMYTVFVVFWLMTAISHAQKYFGRKLYILHFVYQHTCLFDELFLKNNNLTFILISNCAELIYPI